MRLSAFRAGAWVQFLVGDLRSHKLHGAAKKKKRKKERKNTHNITPG